MFDEMEINADRVPLYKLILHVLQIVLSFVSWCLEIAVFRSSGASLNGQSSWAFAVCFLSLPAWIYLIGAPRFPRTRRFAEPHAMVVVDALFCILWLSAFAAQAAYNSSGKCGNGCNMSKAIVAFGVFNTVLFGVTTFLSLYSLKYYQFNGQLPGYDRLNAPPNAQNIDPDMAAFSTAPMGEEPYARLHDMDAEYGGGREQSPPSRINGPDDFRTDRTDDFRTDVGAYGSNLDTGYMGAGAESSVSGSGYEPPAMQHLGNPFDEDSHVSSLRPAASATSLGTSVGHSTYMAPTVHDDYDDDNGRPVRFPEADYDRH